MWSFIYFNQIDGGLFVINFFNKKHLKGCMYHSSTWGTRIYKYQIHATKSFLQFSNTMREIVSEKCDITYKFQSIENTVVYFLSTKISWRSNFV